MKEFIFAIFLDLLIGDPYSFPHPVRLMGHLIEFETKIIRRFSSSSTQLQLGGIIIVIGNMILSFLIPYVILIFTEGWLHFILKIYLLYTCISAKMLAYEALQVKKALQQSLVAGRKRVGYIVGRDTAELTEEEVIKATIETVAENTSDGIIAPLFYYVLLSVPGAMMYKMINTMDSMIGYKNEEFIDIGKFPALIDDVFNFIPARLTALIMLLANASMESSENAFKIVRRDHGNHSSPNAGYPESAVAGLLGIQLGGGHMYFGEYVEKPTIGDETRPVKLKDIDRTNKIMYRTFGFFVVIYVLLHWFITI